MADSPLRTDARASRRERASLETPPRRRTPRSPSSRAEPLQLTEMAFIGTHPLLDKVRAFVRRVACDGSPRVLVTGAGGTGKSLLARVVHELSGASGHYVTVSCADPPTSRSLELELFGDLKDKLSSAGSAFDRAARGTLVLDRIERLSPQLQLRLLSLLKLDEMRAWRGGPWRTVIACTAENLKERRRIGAFLPELGALFDQICIELPQLARMLEIVEEVAGHFVLETCRLWNRSLPPVGPRAFSDLLDHSWPGNVWELRHVIEQAVLSHPGGELIVKTPERPHFPGGVLMPYGRSLEEIERRYLAATFEVVPHESFVRTATSLGIARKTLWEKRRRYGL